MGLFPPAPGGGEEIAHGYKGKGSLIHLLTDYNGNPLAITTTSAKGDERKEVIKLLDKVKFIKDKNELHERAMIILEADKGYDSGRIRQILLDHGIFPFIPWRKIGKSEDRPSREEVSLFFAVKSVRWKVERSFSWLKRKYRRLMIRWERLSRSWNALATLALIHFWQNILSR